MKKRFYVSWSPGLLENPGALKILKDSGLVEGVETRLNGEDLNIIKDVGLKLSLHRPPFGFNLNFGDKDFIDFFQTEEGRNTIKEINDSDASTVGFHLSFVDENFVNSEDLFNTLLNNILLFGKKINKRVVFESVPRESKFGKYINVINDPSFVRKLLESSKNEKLAPGFLFDISHNYVIANGLLKKGLFNRGVSSYFELLIKEFSGRINQLHVNVPEQMNGAYFDSHGYFDNGDLLSQEILELTDGVIKGAPELETITLEMYSAFEPVVYARKMVKQAEILSEYLF